MLDFDIRQLKASQVNSTMLSAPSLPLPHPLLGGVMVFGRVRTTRPVPVGARPILWPKFSNGGGVWWRRGAKLYTFGHEKSSLPVLATSIANHDGI